MSDEAGNEGSRSDEESPHGEKDVMTIVRVRDDEGDEKSVKVYYDYKEPPENEKIDWIRKKAAHKAEPGYEVVKVLHSRVWVRERGMYV